MSDTQKTTAELAQLLLAEDERAQIVGYHGPFREAAERLTEQRQLLDECDEWIGRNRALLDLQRKMLDLVNPRVAELEVSLAQAALELAEAANILAGSPLPSTASIFRAAAERARFVAKPPVAEGRQ